MWSRRDDVPVGLSVSHALAHGVVGMGGVLGDPSTDAKEAVEATRRTHGDGLARRLERFMQVHPGAYVWTRSAAFSFHVGRVGGPWRYDSSDAAVALDLVNVRPCNWLAEPVDSVLVPRAVLATFARAGRNFQQIHTHGVEADTARAWDLLCD